MMLRFRLASRICSNVAAHRTLSSPALSLVGATPSNAQTLFRHPARATAGNSPRWFASMSEKDLNKRLEDFQDLFVEARLCIEDCTDSAGTKYFDEEAEAATEAVEEAVAAFKALIGDIDDEDQKNRILRGNGLKVEQLKGELEMVVKGGHDH